MKVGDKYIIEIERNCIKFLQDSGWMEKHDDAIYQKGLRHGCSYLTDDDCIKMLKASGWLEEHDKSVAYK